MIAIGTVHADGTARGFFGALPLTNANWLAVGARVFLNIELDHTGHRFATLADATYEIALEARAEDLSQRTGLPLSDAREHLLSELANDPRRFTCTEQERGEEPFSLLMFLDANREDPSLGDWWLEIDALLVGDTTKTLDIPMTRVG